MKTGFDQYDKLHADAVKWLKNGWCDYFVPQCYWKTGSTQSFLALANWWADNNPKDRNIYTGLFTSRVDWPEPNPPNDGIWNVDEILGQIMISRLVPGVHGHVHFSQICLSQNRMAISEILKETLYWRQ